MREEHLKVVWPLKGAVLPLKTCPGLNQCGFFFFVFLPSPCLCAPWEFCTSTSKEYLGWEAAALGRKRWDDYFFQDGVTLHSVEHALTPSPLMQKVLEMASGAQSSKLELKGHGHVSGHTAAAQRGAGTMRWGG